MEFNEEKCKVLLPERISPEAKVCGHDTAMGACSLESQTRPGLQQRQHGQQVKRGDSPPLHHSCETIWSTASTPGVTNQSLNFRRQDHRSGEMPQNILQCKRDLQQNTKRQSMVWCQVENSVSKVS